MNIQKLYGLQTASTCSHLMLLCGNLLYNLMKVL